MPKTNQTKKQLDQKAVKILLKVQKDECNAVILYSKIAKRQKNSENKKVLNQISKDEQKHYEVWKSYTKQDVNHNSLYIFWCILLSYIFGYTFVIKILERSEKIGAKNYKLLSKTYPEAIKIQVEEEKHEEKLISLLEDSRVSNIGAMVLGINDAIVELTGSIAGFTFAYMDTKLTALSAIIVGISATLSMASASFLSEKARGNKKAILACLYTGVSYLVVVILMTLPFLLFPSSMYLWAFITMIGVVVLVVMVMSFYISVVQGKTFWKHFLMMLCISLGVAGISYGIGVLAKTTMGISV